MQSSLGATQCVFAEQYPYEISNVTLKDTPCPLEEYSVHLAKFPLKGAPKVKEVLAKNVPYAREAPKINFDRVFHTKAKTRSKLILEASRPGPLSP